MPPSVLLTKRTPDGLLICDRTRLVFSPAPLLIEAGSQQVERPNAIQLEDVPQCVAADVGLGAKPDLERRVGLDPVAPHQIDEVEKELANAPPARFDLARRVRVFNKRFILDYLQQSGNGEAPVREIADAAEAAGLNKNSVQQAFTPMLLSPGLVGQWFEGSHAAFSSKGW